MSPEQIQSARAELARKALARFNQRRESRDAKFRLISAEGVLAAAGMPAAVRRASHLTVAEGRTFEAIVGRNDSDQFNFLHRGIRAGKAVCRLLSGRTPLGTGFLIAPGLLMTNSHVIADIDDAQSFVAEFQYELDADDNPLRPIRFQIDTRLFVISPRDQLDFTITALRPAAGEPDLRSFGWLPLDPRPDKILEGEPVVIIQHSDGKPKELCLFDSQLVDRDGDYIQYTTDTYFGSSGSPDFNRHWQLIALHHASVETGERHKGRPVVVNEGVRVSRIVEALRTGQGATGTTQEVYSIVSDPQILGGGRPAAVEPAEPQRLAPIVGFEARATVIKERPASHFRGRKGYDPAFLGTGALRVDLPGMPRWMQDDTTRLESDSAKYELKYQHFSIVMSASRRIALITAVNIDGSTFDTLVGRLDRDPDNPSPNTPRGRRREFEAAADKWFYDGRIATDAQLGPELYDDTDFAFGHLVRRQDPVWGDERVKRVANDDTFFMTNCSPMHKDFNGAGQWLKLEDAILKSAVDHELRMTVFTGPVLDPRDPEIMGVQCPRAFWKVIAYEAEGRLAARGFLKWQTEHVEAIRREFESLDRLDDVSEDAVPIREIASLTSLDFSALAAFDAHQGRRRRIDESLIGTFVKELTSGKEK